MKKLLVFILALSLALPAIAGTCDVGLATFEAPEGFVFEKGSTDSVLGSLTRTSDGFVIRFDVGGLAGAHMGESMKAQCTFFRRHSVDGATAFTGIQWIPDGQRITTTIHFKSKNPQSPANFWAEIHKDSDLAEFLLIVASFKVKPSE